RPSGHVAEHVDRALHVALARVRHRLAVVERFQLGELVGMLLEQVAEPPDQPRAVTGRHARPRTILEGAPCRGDSQIDIGLLAGRHVRDDLLSGRVLDGEGLAAAGGDPLAVDQELQLLRQEGGGGGAEGRLANGDGHVFLRSRRANSKYSYGYNVALTT